MRVNDRTNLSTPWLLLSRLSILLGSKYQKDYLLGTGTLFEKKQSCRPIQGHGPGQGAWGT